MSSITVTLSEERLAQLREMATQLQTTPEELARASIEDLLIRGEPDFDEAAWDGAVPGQTPYAPLDEIVGMVETGIAEAAENHDERIYRPRDTR